MEANHPLKPAVFVIFGAGGDLTRRKLVPALYNLFLDRWLTDKFEVLGMGLGEMSDAQFRDHLRRGVEEFSRRGKTRKDSWKEFAAHLHFSPADLTDAKAYKDLARQLSARDEAWDFQASRIFYLALPPSLYEPVARMLGQSGLSAEGKNGE